MKERNKFSMNSLLTALARKSAYKKGTNPQNAMIIPPASPGSLGDAAMISVACGQLKERHPHVALVYGGEWPLDTQADHHFSGERYFYKGSGLHKARLIYKLFEFEHVCFIGADVIDGAYNPKSVCRRLSIISEAARLGKSARILGSSYNKVPELTTREKLRSLPQEVVVCARDPVSKKRMEEELNRPIRLTADLAFLLDGRPEEPDVEAAKCWISERRKRGDQIIAVNANYLHLRKNPRFTIALTELMQRFLLAGFSIVLIPHDIRSARPDAQILKDCAEALSSDLRSNVYMMPPRSPGAIKSVLSYVDLLVSGRMHAAILAMSNGTPAFSFGYQDKFEGLYGMFELPTQEFLSVPENLIASPERIFEQIIESVNQAGEFKSVILKKLPSVIDLAKENFQ